MRWVFFLLSYWCWQLGGPAGVIVFQTLVIAAAYGIIALPFRRQVMTVPGMLVLGMGVNAAANRFILDKPDEVLRLIRSFLGLPDDVAGAAVS